ncbi:MAG: 1-deoxy-D-xylulose-5-phosphate synthase [Parachlamydiales bacterium]|jgi:1-deoxy-D-xylulose-5-phosphate synthase
MSKLLPTIKTPEDLQKYDFNQLNELAAEIRQRIIEVMSVNGGHLASNLGTVELTLALHKVFQSPKDKFIWDVSHQTYTHKILTGRNDRFPTIRQYQGLSGFGHPKESPHDHFHAGHAGTALSLALGVAQTRDLMDEDNYVIPVIGDATLTCGMSLEALNNLPRDLKKFIIILNDNAMSISKNVGAITRILSRILSNPLTHKIHQELDSLVSKIPSYGPALSRQGHKISSSLKNLVSPASFFEHYGVSYIGPVDGHDIKELTSVLEKLKNSSWPVILHILTNKGQGMEAAIANPTGYHGARPFHLDTGKFIVAPSPKPTFPQVFGKHILEMADNDPILQVVTPAMSCGSCLDAFMQKYPQRCLDAGIAESHAITFCGGLAYGGKTHVVASIYSTFLQRAFDNLFHDICLQELPVVFAIDRAGLAGADGATHNGIYDISFLNAMPNMVIAQPRNGDVLKDLLSSAFSWNRPTAIRYPNLATEVTEAPRVPRPLGKGEILAQGSKLAIIALGHMNKVALEVREQLKQWGVEASVVDPIFVKPLDSELLCDLLTTHQTIVTIEEHSAICGLGSILNNFLMTNGYSNVQVLNFGVPEAYIEQGTHAALLKEIGLTSDNITNKIVSQFELSKQASIQASSI